MGILLLDTTSRKIEFGYAENNMLIMDEQLSEGNNADTLIYFLKQSFEKRGLNFENIETIGLSNGPGSFTGLRIGSAIAKGICFSVGCRLAEIPTLDVIANKSSRRNRVTSLIPSNMRTQEFYFSSYIFEPAHQNLNSLPDRMPVSVSGYKSDVLENILTADSEFVINETPVGYLHKDLSKKITDVSGASNIRSLYEITLNYISENKFSDYKVSEPFYIKDFIPIKSKR